MGSKQVQKKLSMYMGHVAALHLLQTYQELAYKKQHILSELLMGTLPKQWEHYPTDDAIDSSKGYQWFYHSHNPNDRPNNFEHGHIHLFARRALWARRLRSHAEKEFQQICGNPQKEVNTRHLLAIGLDAKGIPISLFTVNSWVTGDLMVSQKLTLEILKNISLNTGYKYMDSMIESVIQLCIPEIEQLMRERDDNLVTCSTKDKLNNETLELLSSVSIDLDKKLREIL